MAKNHLQQNLITLFTLCSNNNARAMISVADAARFAEESVSIRKFKPWWEIALDYLILLLLLLTIFSWAKVISVESSGLLCIPLDPNLGYSFNLAKYFNSRCAQEFKRKLLLYFPYILFVQWLVLAACQRLWLKIPCVKSKFESYHELFKEMKIVNCLRRSKDGSKDDQNHREEVKEEMDAVYERLMLLLNQKTHLTYIYSAKVSTGLALSLAMCCMMVAWAGGLDFFQANFPCALTGAYAPVRDFVCNFKPAKFLYVVIICNIIVLSGVLILSAYICYWMFTSKWMKNKSMMQDERRPRKNNISVFRSTKGFRDFCFCISLIKLSILEEKAVQNIIAICSDKYFAETHKERRVNVTNDVINDNHHGDSSRDFTAVKYICDYLGLTILQVDESLTTRFEEVYKEFAEEDRNQLCNDDFAKIASRINRIIVVVHCECDGDLRDVYHPSSSNAVNKHDFDGDTNDDDADSFLYICFIRPFHLHVTSKSAATSHLFRGRRTRYATEQAYRKTLKQEAVFKMCIRTERTNRSSHDNPSRRSLQFSKRQEPTVDCLVQLGERVFNKDDDCLDNQVNARTPFIGT